VTRQGAAAEANISASFRSRSGLLPPLAAAIEATNAVTVILTFTTASQRDELMKEER
jgi:hypothetical protein